MKNAKKIIASVVVTAMALSLASCSEGSTKDKKSKKDADVEPEEIVEVAEDFTEALKEMDSKKIKKLSTELDEDAFDDFVEDYEDDKYAFMEILESTDFDIDEDNVEIDDDEASIKIEYSYLPAVTIEGSDAGDDVDEVTNKLTLKFEIDGDDIKVSNADKAVDSYYSDILNCDYTTVGGVVVVDKPIDYVDLEYSYFVIADDYEISPTDDFKVTVWTYDYSELDDANVTLSLLTYDGQQLYSRAISLESDAELEFSISTSDVGVVKFDVDSYIIRVTLDDYDFYDETYVAVVAESNIPANNGGNEFDGNFATPDDDMYGYVVDTTYYNDYFGFSVDMGSEAYVLTEEEVSGTNRNYNGIYTETACIFGTMDNVEGGLLIYLSKVPNADDLDFSNMNDGSTYGSFGGFDCVISPDQTMYLFAKDDAVLILVFDFANIDDGTWMNSVLSTIKAI